MPNKKALISIVLSIFVTAIIFFSPISFNFFGCTNGGFCDVGCPSWCNTIGAPFAYYYWGVHDMTRDVISQILPFGLVADFIIWGILIFLIFKFYYKK